MTHTIAPPRVLVDGLTFGESARWHDGRFWFAHWGSGEVVAVDADGTTEVHGGAPDGYGWSVDWLPDGRRLTTGPGLLLTEPDGSTVEHGRLRDIAAHGWNEIVVAATGDVYVNGFEFDLAGGGAPQPGVIALVRADGSTVRVAGDLQFPNGMVLTADSSTLVVAESFAGRLTGFDVRADGTLGDRRVWAGGIAPDGICLDAEGGIWSGSADIRMLTGRPDGPAGAVVRVLEGGTITDRVELDRPAFSCALGGPAGTTLVMLAMEWHGFDVIDETAAARTGQVLATEVRVPAS